MFANGRTDILRLSAIAMRRNDQTAGDMICDLGAEIAADDVEAEINPGGAALTKDQYLGGIASGEIDYRVWEPDSTIEVRLYGQVALIRYRAMVPFLLLMLLIVQLGGRGVHLLHPTVGESVGSAEPVGFIFTTN